MNETIVVMQRFEMKYILTLQQSKYLKEKIKDHMHVDQYGLSKITSLYYDTPSYQLIRDSVDKPIFKEKIRLRGYGEIRLNSPVFLELKRKSEGVVYKRRLETTIQEVDNFMSGKSKLSEDSQIAKELTYFKEFYGKLVPSCLIIYDRTAYEENDGDLRLTIDENIRYQLNNLRIDSKEKGQLLFENNYSILEIKVQDSLPIWLSHILDEGHIRNDSISKYGEVYKQKVLKVTDERNNKYVNY